MQLSDIVPGLAWLDDGERARGEVLVRALAATFEAHGVTVTPLVALRVENLVAATAHIVRIESRLDPHHEPETEPKGRNTGVDAAVEASFKARERLAKTMKELEDALTKAGTPVDTGIADRLKPLLRETQGVIEDALRFEAQKEKREKDA